MSLSEVDQYVNKPLFTDADGNTLTLWDFMMGHTLNLIRDDHIMFETRRNIVIITRYLWLIGESDFLIKTGIEYPRALIDYLSLGDMDFFKISLGTAASEVRYKTKNILEMKRIVHNLIVVTRYEELAIIYSAYHIAKKMLDNFSKIDSRELAKIDRTTIIQLNGDIIDDINDVDHINRLISEAKSDTTFHLLRNKVFQELKEKLPILFHVFNKVSGGIFSDAYWARLKEVAGYVPKLKSQLIDRVIDDPSLLADGPKLPKDIQNAAGTYLRDNLKLF